MKKTKILLLSLTFLLLFLGQNVFSQKDDQVFYDATNKWFAAWKLISQDIYKIDTVKPVDFVFFDEKYVYSTSAITIPNGEIIKGNMLMNLSLSWKKKEHHNAIILPDGSEITAQLLSFASENQKDLTKAYFVMPLPNFWKNAAVESKELGLDNLVCGVFIHEFSHSQQMQNFAKSMTAFEKARDYEVEFSDDIVQNLFGKDTNYTTIYNNEVDCFYNATLPKKLDKTLVRKGLANLNERQKAYFKDNYSGLDEIDTFFLTMEGLGQYSMYLWMINPKGGNIEKNLAITGVRRNKKWWSQDEGFVLFLVLEKMSKPKNWAKDMFGNQTINVLTLIENKL